MLRQIQRADEAATASGAHQAVHFAKSIEEPDPDSDYTPPAYETDSTYSEPSKSNTKRTKKIAAKASRTKPASDTLNDPAIALAWAKIQSAKDHLDELGKLAFSGGSAELSRIVSSDKVTFPLSTSLRSAGVSPELRAQQGQEGHAATKGKGKGKAMVAK